MKFPSGYQGGQSHLCGRNGKAPAPGAGSAGINLCFPRKHRDQSLLSPETQGSISTFPGNAGITLYFPRKHRDQSLLSPETQGSISTFPGNTGINLYFPPKHRDQSLLSPEIQGSISAFPDRVIPVTQKLVISWQPRQAPETTASALGLNGPVSE